MEIKQTSCAEIPAKELAKWVAEKGEDTYWTVDGDPVLTGRLSVPCPGDELASEVRSVGKTLLVFDPRPDTQVRGRMISASELDDFVESEELGTSVLQLCWKGSETVWLLIEDEETSKSVARENSAS